MASETLPALLLGQRKSWLPDGGDLIWVNRDLQSPQ
jgi:hypothetical protein